MFIITDVPKSDTFDVTLIIALLRHLTDLNPPHGGFDCLPAAIETTPGSDLARIKYYRNYFAHLNDAMLENNFFNTSWDDISQVCFMYRTVVYYCCPYLCTAGSILPARCL